RPHAGAALELGWHVEDIAFDVELPTMVKTAQTALFVAAKRERGLTMRAMLAEHAETALAVAKHEEVLAEQPAAHRCAVGLGYFFGHADRQPMVTHELPHRRGTC